MTGQKVTRRVYSAEELHRLRVSCSQPKLREAIEEHDSEDAELVKEHVLRGSHSFAARSFRSRTSGNSLRVPSNKENRSTTEAANSRSQSSEQDMPFSKVAPVLGEIPSNGQILRSGFSKLGPSPTPSLKKKKAEAIVQAHGSPQHVRVTAGGRIVPSEQSPLCHPRYGYSAIKANNGLIKFAPNHPMGKAQWTSATQNGFVAQDVNGRLYQIVNGTILPLNEVDGALRLYVPAPNLNITSRTTSITQSGQGLSSNNDGQRHTPSQAKPLGPADPPLPAQTNALELEYSKLEHELKELDKTEVLHGRTMGKAAKEALISKRRELVITLDNIRKAIKSIKSMPAQEAPTSPRITPRQQSISPTKSRLPAFLHQRTRQSQDINVPPGYGPFFGLSQPQPYNGQYGYPPSPEIMYSNASFAMGQPPLYLPPPPFDGSMTQSINSYQEPTLVNGAAVPPMPANIGPSAETGTIESRLPQTDGAASLSELQKIPTPGRSRAVDIKLPESKPSWSGKSNLNPMSPAYKPANGVLQKSNETSPAVSKSVKDRVPTPLSPPQELRPNIGANQARNVTDDTISPTKKSPHLHSSSTSSYETADFFPRNTREYSTRKHAYPEPPGSSEDKENISPGHSAYDADGSADAFQRQSTNAKNTSSGGYNTPAVPPGTPVNRNATKVLPSSLRNGTGSSERSNGTVDINSVPDRQTHNLSPKGRRQEYLFVQEDPRQLPSLPPSSPDKADSYRKEPGDGITTSDAIDYSNASREWIEGYRAGLARKPVESDRTGDFLGGYCAGLLKSKPSKVASTNGSPKRPTSRRPSPSVLQSRSASRQEVSHQDTTPSRSPFENNVHSMDTLKEAVFAPQNESALLSPSAEGPHVNEAPHNLGAWRRSHDESLVQGRGDGLAGFPFPYRTASMLRRQGIVSDDDAIFKQHFQPPNASHSEQSDHAQVTSELSAEEASHHVASLTGAFRGMNLGTPKKNDNRVTSMTSIDSNIHYQWPGPRVFSNQLEWKSASSVAEAAGLAAGKFGSGQFDGESRRLLQRVSSQFLGADAQGSVGGVQPQRPQSIASDPTMQVHSRFKEGSLDGITNPPNSPQPISPPTSPSMPAKDGFSPSKHRKKDSPNKAVSPSKVKFENLAEKVGIKVSSGVKKTSTNSPPGKRGWRDVWRGGSRKDLGKHDGVAEKHA